MIKATCMDGSLVVPNKVMRDIGMGSWYAAKISVVDSKIVIEKLKCCEVGCNGNIYSKTRTAYYCETCGCKYKKTEELL